MSDTITLEDGTVVRPLATRGTPTQEANMALKRAGAILDGALRRDPLGGWVEAEEALLVAFNEMTRLLNADPLAINEFTRKWSEAHHRFCSALKDKGVLETI